MQAIHWWYWHFLLADDRTRTCICRSKRWYGMCYCLSPVRCTSINAKACVWWIQNNHVHNGMEFQLLETDFIQDSSMFLLSCKCISLHITQVGALVNIEAYVHGHVISSGVLRSQLIDLQVRYILENCKEDMEFFNQWVEKGIITRLTVCPIKCHLNYDMSV